MKRVLFFSFALLIYIGCDTNNSSKEPSSDSSNASVQSIDLTGFEVVDLSNGYQKVTKEDANGKTLEEGVIRNGKRNGTWVVYQDKRPLPKLVANFIDDQYSGVYMEYSTTGQLELICNYKENVLHGKFIRIKNTRLLEEGNYINGQIDGLYKKFYPNKDLIQQEANYKMDNLDGQTNYYNEDGQLIMQYEYKDGQKISGGEVTPSSIEGE